MSHHLLIEIGTEELPPTALNALSAAFTLGIVNGLKAHNLPQGHATSYATPRRLAVSIADVDATTPVENVTLWGPPAKIAFDAEGLPTKAAHAFAKKNNVEVAELKTENDGKIDKLCLHTTSGGQAIETFLHQIIETALTQLPIKKRMRWGATRTEFVRPIHWINVLLNDTVFSANIFGIDTANTTRGHRFHASQDITIPHASQYAEIMQEQGHIIVDFAQRKTIIEEHVKAQAKQQGGSAVIDPELLNEVTGLVEWPVALSGHFDAEFLSIPSEALISSMKEHQKYFHVVDANDQLLPIFITVSNIESQAPEKVIDGNERVIRPRLADAAFFFNTDKKTSLEQRRDTLKNVVFQVKLGSIFDKTERIKALATHIATQLEATHAHIYVKHIARPAELCKSDLVSQMVGEFPEMQGIAGYHYALNDGEHVDIAVAIKEQYKPAFSGDTLASTHTGAIIALADRLDTITGIFGIGEIPTGSKDPFALRRASLGALRIIVEQEYALDLHDLLATAQRNFSQTLAESTVNDAFHYMIERFKSWYSDANIAAEVFQAVSAKQLSEPLDIHNRVYAVADFCQLPEAQALAAANKRVSNIIAKQEQSIADTVDLALLQESAERNLSDILTALQQKASPLFADKKYGEAFTCLAQLQAPVDAFFDDVMVMTDDIPLRNNRLALLQQLRNLFLEIADISYLVIKR